MKHIPQVLLLLVLFPALAVADRVNVAPLAHVYGSARMDGSRAATNINDEDPRSLWTAWPYNMRDKEDMIVLEVTLPLTVQLSRIEIDTSRRPPELQIYTREGKSWQPLDSRQEWNEQGLKIGFEKPIEMESLRFEFKDIRANNSGVAISEFRLMAEIPDNIKFGKALGEEETPDLDWEEITGGFETDSSWSEGKVNPWKRFTFKQPQEFQRLEMDWRGADYARRTLLVIETADGETLFIPRHRYSTSFTLEKPVKIKSLRLLAIDGPKGMTLNAAHLYSKGRKPAPPKDPIVKVWPESSLVKIPKDASGPSGTYPYEAGSLRVELAANEYEAGQVVVRNEGKQVLRNLSVEIGDLKSATGSLSSAEMAWNPIGYVNGEYGDVLMEPEPFRIPAGEARPVWITVHANAGQKSGLYKGVIRILCAGQEIASLPLEAEVWDVKLPHETHFNTHYFGVWGVEPFFADTLDNPETAGQLLQSTRQDFINHRIAPGNVFVIEEHFKRQQYKSWAEYLDAFDQNAQLLIDSGLPFQGGLPQSAIKFKDGPQTEAEYFHTMQEHLRAKGWLDRFAVQVGDEPPPGNQRVTNRAKQIREMAPDLLRQCAFSSFGVGGTDTWVGLVNAWGIGPRYYGEDRLSDLVEFCRERREAGDNVAWYIHQWLSVEAPPYFTRSYFWYTWRYRIPGALLYAVSEWAHREVGRWEDGFVIEGLRHNAWGVSLWPGRGRFLDSVRWEMMRDGIEDYELHLLLEQSLDELAAKDPNHYFVKEGRKILDDTDPVFVALDSDQRESISQYRIQDTHGDNPYFCINAVPADMLNTRKSLVEAILKTRKALEDSSSSSLPGAPRWARLYTEGLQAWRDLIYYWIDRQKSDGTFGFGWGDDCEMVVGWPGIMMAADDQRIEQSLSKLADNTWYNPTIQRGYPWLAADSEHNPEPISYSIPILAWQQFGSPKILERMMITSQNLENWLAQTPKGDWHMRSSYFGSKQIRDWEFYDEDCPINARAWLPMMQLAIYNRDPELVKYITRWADSWVKHAMDTQWNKPPGFLPGQVVFKTGEPGGYTHNWWGAGAHEFNSLWYQTRMHELLVVAYYLTGEDKYIAPLREELRFLSTYAKPRVERGAPLPPDRLPEKYDFPPGWRDGEMSTHWAQDAGWGHIGRWYYYMTGDDSFDKAFNTLIPDRPLERGPYERINDELVEREHRRATTSRDKYYTEIVPKLEYLESIANYAAAWWMKGYGTMTFGQRCFHDGTKLANAVNWPWVDFPPPSVVWKDTGYTTAIFVLQDDPDKLRVALCNVAAEDRSIGMQVFTLDEGDYRLRLGPDVDEDGSMDSVKREKTIRITRGTIVPLDLQRNVTHLVELTRMEGQPVPVWQPRPDVALDDWDIMASKENPQPGEEVTLTLRVHNIGTRPAENIDVHVWAQEEGTQGTDRVQSDESGMRLIKTTTLDRLVPPVKLEPSYKDLQVQVMIPENMAQIGVSVDPKNLIEEIYNGNNTAWIALKDIKTAQRAKEFIQHEPARKPSLNDVDPEKVSRYEAPFREGIQLDGRLDDDAWKGAPEFIFIGHSLKVPVQKATTMRVVYDEKSLYVGLHCEEPDMDKIKTDLADIHQVYYNDGFEIFIDPGAQVWRYWQFAFDTVPHKFQTKTRNEHAIDRAEWDVAIAKDTDSWSAEVRFPLDGFDVPPPKPGNRWRLNVMRFTTTLPNPEHPERNKAERSHFSPKDGLSNHHDVTVFGDLVFGKKK